MPWSGKDGQQQGPWGKPPAGRPHGGGNGGGGDKRPPGKSPNSSDFDLDAWLRGIQDKLNHLFGGNNNGRMIGIIAGIFVVLWLLSGIYLVRADEEGVVTRFGKYVRSTPPGMSYHMPYPIETVATPRVTAVNRVEIGMRSGGKSGQTDLPEESLMLTGDENIIDINFEVQWKIAKAQDYLFNVRNPEATVKAVAESAMREVIGSTSIATVLAEGKLKVEQDTKELMQEILESYKGGMEVVSVNLLKADPPTQVIDAFRDVQTARADLETARNQAAAYRNDIIPRARGEAGKMVLDAEGYRQEVTARARGEAERFRQVYSEYKTSKDVTRRRLYLETMEDILHGMNKVIVDSKGTVPYLPLPALTRAEPKETK